MSGADPLISVLMPVYNAEPFLRNAIESILDQSFEDWELVIINDGSTDDSEAVIQEYLHNPRIVYQKNQSNLGYARSCNIGFRKCLGKYIAFQDADDVSLPSRLEVSFATLEKHQECLFLFSQVNIIDKQGHFTNIWGGVGDRSGVLDHRQYFYKLYVEGNFIPNPSLTIRNKADQQPKFREDLSLCNDFYYYLESMHAHDIYYLAKPLVNMRRDDKHKTMTSNREKNFSCERKIIRDIYTQYRSSSNLSLNVWHYRNAMSNQYLKENNKWRQDSLTSKRFKSVLMSLVYQPLNKELHKGVLREYGTPGLYQFVKKIANVIKKYMLRT